MVDNLTKLLQISSKEQIISILKEKLGRSDESNFLKEKVIPYVESVLSILLPLKG